jgi:hypothetical protein
MKKILLIVIACLGLMFLAGCYKDDLNEFQSIKHFDVNEELALALIHQTLDTGFYNPLAQPLPVGMVYTFRLSDTASLELPAPDTTNFFIEEVTFKGISENRFTGSGDFTMVFLDSLGARKDSLPDSGSWIIDAAPVGGVAKNDFSLTVDEERYEELRQYKKVILQVDITTNTAGIPPGYNNLNFTYYVGIKIKGRARIDF